MRLVLFCVLFSEYYVQFCFGGKEKIHFKIHVPEINHHHHHTRYVYLHHPHDHSSYYAKPVVPKKLVSSVIKKPVVKTKIVPTPVHKYKNGFEHYHRYQSSHKYGDDGFDFDHDHDFDFKTHSGLHDDDDNVEVHHTPSLESHAEKHTDEKDYDKIVGTFETDYEKSKKKPSLEKIKDLAKFKNDLKSKNVYYHTSPFSYGFDDGNGVKKTHKTIKSEHIEIESVENPNDHYGFVPVTAKYEVKEEFPYDYSTESYHSFSSPYTHENNKKEEEKDPYNLPYSSYDSYFPETHNAVEVKKETDGYGHNFYAPYYHDDSHENLNAEKEKSNDYHYSGGGSSEHATPQNVKKFIKDIHLGKLKLGDTSLENNENDHSNELGHFTHSGFEEGLDDHDADYHFDSKKLAF